jgi:nicotinate-nucleotide--dimethylbenzimidazole phosphoribosyltransferase
MGEGAAAAAPATIVVEAPVAEAVPGDHAAPAPASESLAAAEPSVVAIEQPPAAIVETPVEASAVDQAAPTLPVDREPEPVAAVAAEQPPPAADAAAPAPDAMASESAQPPSVAIEPVSPVPAEPRLYDVEAAHPADAMASEQVPPASLPAESPPLEPQPAPAVEVVQQVEVMTVASAEVVAPAEPAPAAEVATPEAAPAAPVEPVAAVPESVGGSTSEPPPSFSEPAPHHEASVGPVEAASQANGSAAQASDAPLGGTPLPGESVIPPAAPAEIVAGSIEPAAPVPPAAPAHHDVLVAAETEGAAWATLQHALADVINGDGKPNGDVAHDAVAPAPSSAAVEPVVAASVDATAPHPEVHPS